MLERFETYLLSLQAGPPVVLDDAEMDRVLERVRSYGQQD